MRGDGGYDPKTRFGADYRRFYDLDLGQRFFDVPWRDGHLAVQRFVPAGAVRGSAVVVHGYYDHVGLYGHLIRHLLRRGLAVVAYDQPGHGLSSGARATIESFDLYVEALDAVLAAAHDALPAPIHAVGQSTGGAVLMERLMRPARPPFTKTVLLAPLVRPKGWPLAKLTLSLAGPFLKQVPRGAPRNSDDTEFLAFLREDPLQTWVLPVQWATALAAWIKRFEAYPPTRECVAVIQGGRDGTVDGPHNLAVLRRLVEVELKELPSARHHLVNETEAIRREVAAFLDEHL